MCCFAIDGLIGQVTFTNLSTPTSEIDDYLWNFGDGASGSTATHPAHTYTQTGSFTVVLTATAGSESDTETKVDYVTVSAASTGELVTTTITYTYDSLYRLTEADYSSGENFQYAYDAVGNMTAVTTTITSTVVSTREYDMADRLITVTTDGQVRKLEWSDAGELLRDGDPSTGSGQAYQWDAAGRLVSATVDGVSNRYACLGDGGRISVTVGSETTTYTLDLAAPLVQVLVANEGENTTLYLYGVARIGEDDGTWRYHLADHLGSVRSLVDADGDVDGARAYQPYGMPLSTDGTASSIYGFTGEQTDPTGLVYLRARMYSPKVRLFTSRDWWSGSVRQPGTMHAWSYVQGNPTNSVDPTGRISWQDLLPLPAGGVVNLAKSLYSKSGFARQCLLLDTQQHPSDTVDDLLTDFICEYGPVHRFFEADAHLTQQLAKTATIHRLRGEFYRTGNLRQEEREYQFDIDEFFWATLDWAIESDPTRVGLVNFPGNITHFMASFEYEISRDSMWVYWMVHNQTDLASGSRVPPQLGGVSLEKRKEGISVEEVLETHPWYWKFKSIAAIMMEYRIISILKAKTRDETGGFLGTEGGGNMEQTFRWKEPHFGCDLLPWPAIKTVLRIEKTVPPR